MDLGGLSWVDTGWAQTGTVEAMAPGEVVGRGAMSRAVVMTCQPRSGKGPFSRAGVPCLSCGSGSFGARIRELVPLGRVAEDFLFVGMLSI